MGYNMGSRPAGANMKGAPMDCAALLALEDPSDGPLDEVARRYSLARQLATALTDIANLIESDLAARMEDDFTQVPGVGVLRRMEAHRSTWRYDGAAEQMRDDLARAVAQSIAVDIATGEIDQGKRNVALAAMRAAYSAIPAFSSLKVAGRRNFGLQIGDYRSFETYNRVSIEDGAL